MLRRGGTAFPGLVAERIAPGLLAGLGGQLEAAVLVTGTNGKTTTARLLASILRQAGRDVVANREGSNLTRGILGTLLGRSSYAGTLDAGLLGLFETDEATLPAATAALGPAAIVFLNLFRDQLDRYGEVDSVAAAWRRAIASAPPGCTLVLNADDPSVADLAREWEGPVHWFGLDAPDLAGDRGAFDARWCGVCGADYRYHHRYFAHLGDWACDGCGRSRPSPDTSAAALTLDGHGTAIEVEGLGSLTTPLAGLYNAWNTLAAVAAARVLGADREAIGRGLAAAAPAFGRQELVVAGGRRLNLMLVKNPAGANQVLRYLETLPGPLHFAFLLNDRHADGQDVSWIWDVDFEGLAGRLATCCAGGDRGADAALRLRYAGLAGVQLLPPNPPAALEALLAATPASATMNVILTYTALLDLRRALARLGAAGSRYS